jgi:hypothetical protein
MLTCLRNNVGRQDDERSGTSGEIKLKKVGYLRCEHLCGTMWAGKMMNGVARVVK